MKKTIIFLMLVQVVMACHPYTFESSGLFSSKFGGEYKGYYYKSKNSDSVNFAPFERPRLVRGWEINEIKQFVGDSVVMQLRNIVYMENDKLRKQDRTAIFKGEDKDGIIFTIRMSLLPDSTGRGNTFIKTSNFIQGDYDASKDTVDIYYTRIFED